LGGAAPPPTHPTIHLAGNNSSEHLSLAVGGFDHVAQR
jgi:hypothetical protein